MIAMCWDLLTFALLLLCGRAPSLAQEFPLYVSDEQFGSLARMALRLELTDTKALWVNNYVVELNHHALKLRAAADWPWSQDALRFPDYATCLHGQLLAGKNYERVQIRPPNMDWSDWHTIYFTAGKSYRAWSEAAAARKPETATYDIRSALGRLRDLLGEADFAAGRLPWPIPVETCGVSNRERP